MVPFRERDFGVFETWSPAQAQQRFPELLARQILQSWDDAPPRGETPREVVARVAQGLESLHTQWPESTVALVAHGIFIRALRFLLQDTAGHEFFVQPKIGNGVYCCAIV